MRLGLLESVTQLNSHALGVAPTFLFLSGKTIRNGDYQPFTAPPWKISDAALATSSVW
ncbi:hypothetical protein VCSRO9_0359 [Vibrio cholerae]|nr:hypothetical protein VCSRO9_0359 [Vibrio cholerae]